MAHCACSRNWLIFVVAAATFAPAQFGAAADLSPVKVGLTAKVEDGRFVGVGFSDLEKIRLIPGDKVRITFEGSSEFDAEFWSRRYTWEKTEKRGKKKIITTMTKDAEVTWQAVWGQGIDGVLSLGRKKQQVSVLIQKPATITIVEVVSAAALEFTVQPDPDRVVDRPDDVPPSAPNLTANPPESDPPNVEALIDDGADLGSLVIKVLRPSAD